MASIRAVAPVALTEPALAAFILVTDLEPCNPAWPLAEEQLRRVAASCAPILSFEPQVSLVSMPGALDETIVRAAANGARELFILPMALEFNLLQRQTLGCVIAEARRNHPGLVVHHDDVDPAQPMLVDSLAHQVSKALETQAPQHCGLILAPSGHGDADSRAQSYRLMRCIWERLGLAGGEVGFVRHAAPFLLGTLERCAGSGGSHPWVVLPQSQWSTEHCDFAETILTNFQRTHPCAAGWRMAEPPGAHPVITAWLTQRIVRLWQEKRAREAVRIASPKRAAQPSWQSCSLGAGHIAAAKDRHAMAELLERILPSGRPARVLVKVTWHGYATGTYTDPGALDLLLAALPARAVVLEGHTTSRNRGNSTFDWEKHAKENRAWIREQEAEYLRRTGLQDVLTRHRAQYLNVTEAFWDEACAGEQRVNEILRESGVRLSHPELAQFVPEVLLDYLQCPMISFAKFKGPTRLAVSNMFGLLPEPLRAAWHGPNITYFAQVCCDLARLYGSLFPVCGVNEAVYAAVRWNRQGLYRSRWGNYDLISNSGYAVAAPNLVAADILASRLQGQDVARSAFFDVVRAQLGWDEAAATEPLPQPLRILFA
jgi:sirohydrochlorin ferrochelatase